MGTLNLGGITLSGSGGNWSSAPAGTIIQVKTAQSGPATQVITSTTAQPITGLSVDFVPRSSTSKILVTAAISSTLTYVTSFAVYQDGSPTADTTGFTNDNEPDMDFTSYWGGTTTDDGRMYMTNLQTTLDAGSTNSRTYEIRGVSGWVNVANNLYINNRSSGDMASFSRMAVYEVA